MRHFISGLAVTVLALGLLAACNSDDGRGANRSVARTEPTTATQPARTPSDGIRRITVTELKAAVEEGKVVIVDTRDAVSFANEHIKGSINIPEPEMTARAGELPADKMIVTYCS